MSSPTNSLSVTIPSVHTAALFKRSSKKKSSRGSKKNSTRMPTKGKNEKAGKKKIAFVVKRTNEAALRTVHGDTTSLCTHTHCENASHPQ